MKLKFATPTLLALALAACGDKPAQDTSLLDNPRSVDEYYNDHVLRGQTLEACKASNGAEAVEKQSKPACANALEAESKHGNEKMDKAVQDSNAQLEEAFKKKRAASDSSGN